MTPRRPADGALKGPKSRITTAPATWPEVQDLFATGGDPAGCWCRWFALTGPQFREFSVEQRKEHLRARFDDGGLPPGLLAFRDGQPVGWCAVEPRASYPRILNSPLLKRSATGSDPDTEVWSITCFVVAPSQRRTGVAGALLHAAVEHAVSNGAAQVEGYPVDPAQRPKAGAADLYHGSLGLFLREGFTVVDKPLAGRAVVRLDPKSSAASQRKSDP